MKRPSEIYKSMEEIKKRAEFMPTGFPSLDLYLDGGFMRKELIVLGGETGIGKSYVAGQILYKIADQGYNTAYFSLEISNEMVLSRLTGALANIKANRIAMKKLTVEEQTKRITAQGKILEKETLMSFYDDLYEEKEIVSEIKKNKYDFVVIDFIQNVVSAGKDENERLQKLSIRLQQLAKEIDCCVFVLSQLSNETVDSNAKGGKKRPKYKGSGGIATACDLGFFIERDELDAAVHQVNLFLAKNRRGQSGQAFILRFKVPGGYMYE